jgi:arylsulfatase A-like enzyme
MYLCFPVVKESAMFLQRFYSLFILCCVWVHGLTANAGINPHAKRPRLIIPIVLDQGAKLLIDKVLPYCTGGFQTIHDLGIHFENAYFPHGCPNTAAGHAGLSTGAYPDIHGILDNKYVREDGVAVAADEDLTGKAHVFQKNGSTLKKGKSPINLMADTLADQFMLSSEPDTPHHCATFSLKSRAAIMMAGRQGKAFWFDEKRGNITTSKAYFDTLPDWISEFNNKYALTPESGYEWKPFFEEGNPAYHKRTIHNYGHSAIPSIIGTTIKYLPSDAEPYELFAKSPWGCTMTLNLAHEYIKQNVHPENSDRHLVWISLSGIDKAGHMYGPDSMEVIDLVYHLDAQIEKFIDNVYKIVPADEVLFVLTADHGIFEIPEVMNAKGFTMPKRILVRQMMQSMNNLVKRAYGIADIMENFDAPHFYLNKKALAKVSPETRQGILDLLIHFLKRVPGMRNAWTPDQLLAMNPEPNTYEYRFKRQIYPGRNGEIIFHVNPYIMLTPYPNGTSHATPYWYDVHVPLMLYQHNRWQPKRITQPVSTLRLAATLADIIGIQAPSAADPEPLPEAV